MKISSIIKILIKGVIKISDKIESKLNSSLWEAANELRNEKSPKESLKILLSILLYKKNYDNKIYDISEKHTDINEAKIMYNRVTEKDWRKKQESNLFNFKKINKDLSDEKKQLLLKAFSNLNFAEIDNKILGNFTEDIIDKFAKNSSKNEYYTPRELVELINKLIDPKPNKTYYDPCCGSGSFLVNANNYVKENYNGELKLFGQEINQNECLISKLNLYLHGVDNADIKNGDTLLEPKFYHKNKLSKFDYVVGIPPWNLSYNRKQLVNDKFNRFKYGLPSSNSADWLWVQHMLSSLSDDGKMAIVLDRGALFRSRKEYKIRKDIIDNDLIESIIFLPPNLFNHTSIPTCIIIFNKNKSTELKKKILIIDLEHDSFKKDNIKSTISNCVDVYSNKKIINNFSDLIDHEQIIENDYLINPNLYIEWPSFVNELRKSSSPIESLEENLDFTNDGDFTSDKSFVLIPRSSRKDILLSSELSYENDDEYLDLDKNYYFATIKAEDLEPQYLKLYLNSKPGKYQRQLLSNGVINRIDLKTLKKIKIQKPKLNKQFEIIKCANKFEEINQQINNIDKQFKNNIIENLDITNEFVNKFDISEDDVYYNNLLWPIAISYRLATKGSSNITAKFKNYLALAEEIVVLNVILLISALPEKMYKRNIEYFWFGDDNLELENLKLRERFSFGSLLGIYERVSKEYRSKEVDLRDLLPFDYKVYKILTNKNLINKLNKILEIRNRNDAHTGGTTESHSKESLNEVVPNINNIIDRLSVFSNYNMIMPRNFEYTGDGKYLVKTKILEGVHGISEEKELEFLKPLVSNNLYLYNFLTKEKLKLRDELIKLIQCSKCHSWSMFFVNQINGNKVTYINYQTDPHKYECEVDLNYLFKRESELL